MKHLQSTRGIELALLCGVDPEVGFGGRRRHKEEHKDQDNMFEEENTKNRKQNLC